MSELIRFGVSLPEDLLKKFDEHISRNGYSNRSEAMRDLIREDLVHQQWSHGTEVAGAITVVYDHHQRGLLNRITALQHDWQHLILCSQHIHLDHHNCLEILAVKGPAENVSALANSLKAVKGIKHATLNMTSTGHGIE
ncbi:MAG: nickel-responsive transcriptional regulator NikR [Candidatus Riflebacteria bacterium]|nr:nickel-responsive transcriptional regulator NikR [Candidatus Riflebacteria bacterium]